jgi:NhaP-type Na+/H+ or K+/H+ antiporter
MLVSYLVSKYGHKSIVSNALSNDFIYQYLLPIIVLAEGFNNRKKSLSYYKKEIVSFGVITPLVCFGIFSGFLILLQKVFMDHFGIMKEFKYAII